MRIERDLTPKVHHSHVYGNIIQRGDLSSLNWFQGPLKPKDFAYDIVYSSVNFKDLMMITGRLPVELFGDKRIDHQCLFGFEFSGIERETGRRVMCCCGKAAMGSHVDGNTDIIVMYVPDNWSLKEAASVPVVYMTVYYAFFKSIQIQSGQKILIHAGTGGVGLAAIRVAFAYGLDVYTTCSTEEKKRFLLQLYPKLKPSHIGNSRDTSFENMIMRETNGEGVDIVLNSLAEDKLLASLRCLGEDGHFLEIGKFDMSANNKIGLEGFLKKITFRAILVDELFKRTEKNTKIIAFLSNLIHRDIDRNFIQPLPVTDFPTYELEKAMRHMVGGKHMGKVVVQIRDDHRNMLPVSVLPQVYFDADLVYVIIGGLGGFGLELADWMVLRGARKLVISSSRGFSNSYQKYRTQ